VVLAVLAAGLGIAQAVQVCRQRLLSELCTRYGEGEVLAVTGVVELASFDDPAFDDRVTRAMLAVRSLHERGQQPRGDAARPGRRGRRIGARRTPARAGVLTVRCEYHSR
jgi:hypothetical protein